MKKYINRNYFWADLFVAQLVELGVTNVCISPGSRNTPLTLAFANNKKFNKYINVDERSGSFFALGIAKKIKKPVVILTTSGTAVAELYPAIIESYQQRIPLIVCTADRPAFMRHTGANQTINQENIFSNHIRKFIDFGLPSIKKNRLKSLCKNTIEAFCLATITDPGPIHFNFPLEKPLEPNSFTENINQKKSEFVIRSICKNNIKTDSKVKISKVIKLLSESKKILIYCSWDNYNSLFDEKIVSVFLSKKIPILVDGTNELRFYEKDNTNIIVNHTSFLKYIKEQPDLIIQFGNAPTSESVLKFFEKSKTKRILINKYGDLKDPSINKGTILRIDPLEFLNEIDKVFLNTVSNKSWFEYIKKYDDVCEDAKLKIINNAKFGLEPAIVNNVLDQIPFGSNIFISNSLPIRDFDFFASKRKVNYKIFTNRGASGIDGIISTATGIAEVSKNKTYLIIGDLSFYHNISALSYLYENNIPLTIILINNNGGGIFNMLPVSSDEKNFERYFITKQNLNFAKIIKAFGGFYYAPKSWKTLNLNLTIIAKTNQFSVVEIKTDAKESLELRKNYWREVKSKTENIL